MAVERSTVWGSGRAAAMRRESMLGAWQPTRGCNWVGGVRESGVAGGDGLLAAWCEVSGHGARQALALWLLFRFGREVLMSLMDCARFASSSSRYRTQSTWTRGGNCICKQTRYVNNGCVRCFLSFAFNIHRTHGDEQRQQFLSKNHLSKGRSYLTWCLLTGCSRHRTLNRE
jgi:hypothetical protein